LVMVDFKLDGAYEHIVQKDIIFQLKVTKNGQPADVNFPVEAFLKGSHDEIRGEVHYTHGQYTLQFHGRTIGLYEMHVKVKDNWLYKDGDIIVSIIERPPQKYVELFFEFGGNLLEGNMRVGNFYDLVIYCKNLDGSGKDIDLTDLEVKFGYGQNFQHLKCKRIGTGTYHTECTAELPGVYPLDLHYEGRSVLKEVLQTKWTGASDPRNTKAIQVPTRMLIVGEEGHFFIQSRNSNDLNNTTGGDLYQVRSDGPTELPDLAIRDTKDGKYKLSFTPAASGVYSFHISLNGVPIGNSPVSITAVRK